MLLLQGNPLKWRCAPDGYLMDSLPGQHGAFWPTQVFSNMLMPLEAFSSMLMPLEACMLLLSPGAHPCRVTSLPK